MTAAGLIASVCHGVAVRKVSLASTHLPVRSVRARLPVKRWRERTVQHGTVRQLKLIIGATRVAGPASWSHTDEAS